MKPLSPLPLALVAASVMSLVSAALADDWPQWRSPNREGVWHGTGIMEKFPQPQFKLLWRTPIANSYSGPTVANGRVYVTDRPEEPGGNERVLCLDAQTGKMPNLIEDHLATLLAIWIADRCDARGTRKRLKGGGEATPPPVRPRMPNPVE